MIGLFDSGSGGLSVLKALRARAPKADIAYFGDIANAPYGVRSQDELIELTRRGVDVLRDMGATEIVSACNSVSLSILAGAAGEIPVIEMTRPTAEGMRVHAGKRVLLLATPATIESHIYQDALQSIVALDPLPIAELAGAIEFDEPEEEILRIVRAAFDLRTGATYDLLLLGCTHYPLVSVLIAPEAERAFGILECIDPAKFVAEEAVRRFDTEGDGAVAFKISKESNAFRKRISQMMRTEEYSVVVAATP